MRRIEEINARLIEIRGLLAQDGADIDALEAEVRQLTEEKRSLMDAQTRRQQILDQIAGDNTLEGQTQERAFNQNAGGEMVANLEIQERPEYRRAYLRNLQGAALTQVEQRMLTSAEGSAGHVIPTQTQNEVIRKMIKIAPMLDQITLLHVPGNVNLIVESAMTDASAHTEGAEASEATDKTITVSLGGYEVMKLMSISAKISAMSIDAFEDWLTTILAEGCALKLEDWIINGTGSDQPKGIEKAATWGTANSVTTAAATPTYAEMCSIVALLPAEYDPNAKWLMNKKTFWQKIQAIRDDAKAPIVRMENGAIYCLGYEVLISAKVADNTLYLGDYKQYYGNMAAPIQVESSNVSGFRRNATDYRGTCIFDGKPVVAAAFVKGVVKSA